MLLGRGWLPTWVRYVSLHLLLLPSHVFTQPHGGAGVNLGLFTQLSEVSSFAFGVSDVLAVGGRCRCAVCVRLLALGEPG